MYLSARQRQILVYLLDAEETVTVGNIAGKLDVSERTIHRDLADVEAMLHDYDLSLEKQSGTGLWIAGAASDKAQLASVLQTSPPLEWTAEERKTLILATLLDADEPVKLFTLAANLHVTTATISHDLDRLEADLEDYQLTLIRRRGYGVRVAGEEHNRRAVMSHLLRAHVAPHDFRTLLKQAEDMPWRHTAAISTRLLGFVSPETLRIIEDKVAQTRNELRAPLADSAYIGLVVHLALAIDRLQKDDTIAFDRNYLAQMKHTEESAIAEKLIRRLEGAFHMAIPNEEIGYITMHLQGAKRQSGTHDLLEDAGLDVLYQARALIQYVSNQIDRDLTSNMTLLNDLMTHLKPSIYRLKQGLAINNPMLEDVKRDYGDLFAIVQDATGSVFPDLAFPEDEIAYLVLHFASVLMHGDRQTGLRALVICPSGIGTAKMLATRLKQQIREITHVDNKSVFDLETIETTDYDLIISTTPLKIGNEKYTLTSPMLTPTEVTQLRQIVSDKQRAAEPKPELASNVSAYKRRLENLQVYTSAILTILASFAVRPLIHTRSEETTLQQVCFELADDGIIRQPEVVKQALLNRQAQSGLGIPGTHLALYHLRSYNVVKPSFIVYTLDSPLTIKGMDDTPVTMHTLCIMLAPNAADSPVLGTLSYLSSLLMEEKTIRVLASGEKDAVEQHLSQRLYEWLYDQI